jgi:hypothetical protein
MDREAVHSRTAAVRRKIHLWTRRWDLVVIKEVADLVRILFSATRRLLLFKDNGHALRVQVEREEPTIYAQSWTQVETNRQLTLLSTPCKWVSKVTLKLPAVSNVLPKITVIIRDKLLSWQAKIEPSSKSSVIRLELPLLTVEMSSVSPTTLRLPKSLLECWEIIVKLARIRFMNLARTLLQLIKCALTVILV